MTLTPILEIGGTHVTAATIDTSDWSVRAEVRCGLDSDGSAGDILNAFTAAARQIYTGPAARWGVAIPGPFDYAHGIGDFRGVQKFGELYGVNFATELRARMPDIADEFVFVNDADAFAMGEWTTLDHSVQRGTFLTLGTGIGSSFLDGGRPVADHPGLPPLGHVYLMEWDGRPIEDTVSRRALIRAYRAATGRNLDVREIADQARAGDLTAVAVINAAFRALGACVAPAIAAFDADVIVIGGSIAGSWDLVHDAFVAGLSAEVGALSGATVVQALNPDASPLIGAGRAALMLSPAG